jgi:outer membrane lipoprotein SlyB
VIVAGAASYGVVLGWLVWLAARWPIETNGPSKGVAASLTGLTLAALAGAWSDAGESSILPASIGLLAGGVCGEIFHRGYGGHASKESE